MFKYKVWGSFFSCSKLKAKYALYAVEMLLYNLQEVTLLKFRYLYKIVLLPRRFWSTSQVLKYLAGFEVPRVTIFIIGK